MFDKQASFSLYPDIPSEERNHESLMEGRIRGCWCPRRPPPPIVARIEYVAGRVPAASATQITSLKPYHGAFSGTVDGA